MADDATDPPPKTVDLVSPLPLDACMRRLDEAIDAPWTLFGSRPVIGRFSRRRLYARKRLRYRNSFQTYVRANMVGQDDQTWIRCRFYIHPTIIAFMALWFAGVCGIGGTIFVTSLETLMFGPSDSPAEAWAGAIVPPLMLAFGIGLICVGRYFARHDRQFLLTFLHDTVDARAADLPSPE